MNKNVIIAGVVVVVVLIGIGGFSLLSKSASPLNSTPETSQNGEGEQNAVSSIKDFLTQSGSVKCEMTDEGKTTTAYIKNGLVRADSVGESSNDNSSVIFNSKEKKFYAWSTETKQGVSMSVPDDSLDKMDDKMGTSGDSYEDVMEDLEKYKENCRNASVSDSLFTIPTDVKFQDISTMMGAPSGSSQNNPAIPDEYQKMMEQYAPQQ